MRHNEKGFTLIELAIVMVIVGIIAITVVPKYIDLADQAEQTGTTHELQTIYRSLYNYNMIHGRMPDKLNDVIYIPNMDEKYQFNSAGKIS